MNRHTTGRRGHKADREAAARLSRLRAAGVPLTISGHEAWHLSGGIVGNRGDHEATVPTAKVAKDVPDCEAFLADWREAAGA